MRRFGPRPDSAVRYTDRPGAYGVILRAGRMLLAVNDSPGEEIALPGGGIDPGEHALRALAREVREETGWTLSAAVRIGCFHRFVYMPEYDMQAHKVCHVYLCRPGRRVGAPTEPDHRPVWAEAEVAAAALSTPGDRAMAARALRIAARGGYGAGERNRG